MTYDNAILDVALWSGELELNETNLGTSDSGWTASSATSMLRQEQTWHKFSVLERSAKHRDNANLPKSQLECK